MFFRSDIGVHYEFIRRMQSLASDCMKTMRRLDQATVWSNPAIKGATVVPQIERTGPATRARVGSNVPSMTDTYPKTEISIRAV